MSESGFYLAVLAFILFVWLLVRYDNTKQAEEREALINKNTLSQLAKVIEKNTSFTGYGYAHELVTFDLLDNSASRLVLSLGKSSAALLQVGDIGTLSYSEFSNEQLFISFSRDISIEKEQHPISINNIPSHPLGDFLNTTIISITPDANNTLSRVLFEFEDDQRVKLSVPFAQADLLAPGDKGTLVYEGSTFVSFTRA